MRILSILAPQVLLCNILGRGRHLAYLDFAVKVEDLLLRAVSIFVLWRYLDIIQEEDMESLTCDSALSLSNEQTCDTGN